MNFSSDPVLNPTYSLSSESTLKPFYNIVNFPFLQATRTFSVSSGSDRRYIVQVSDVSKLLIVSGLLHKNQKHWGGRPHVILLIQKMWLAGTVQNTFILRKSKKCFFNSFNRLFKPAEKKNSTY